MRIRNIMLAALALGALVPAVASAQEFGWGPHFGPPPPPAPRYEFVRYGPQRPDFGLVDRETHLQDWMRRGSEEGWLTGWRAGRAWSDLRSIKAETYANYGYGYDRYQINQRLDRLADFVRRAHDDPWG